MDGTYRSLKLLKAPCKSGPVRIICDASLQKQIHPHLRHQYIERTPTPGNNLRPSSRWPVLKKHTHLERANCMSTPDSLIWVFLFQPPSDEEEFLLHRWVLATMNKIENKWQIRYQSTTSTVQHAVVYRTHMKQQRWPPFAPLHGAFSFLWDNPHGAVWFPATLSTNTANICHPPPHLDPISFIIQAMQRAKDVRASMNGNKKWDDLLRYHDHDTNENIRNPFGHSVMNITNIRGGALLLD